MFLAILRRSGRWKVDHCLEHWVGTLTVRPDPGNKWAHLQFTQVDGTDRQLACSVCIDRPQAVEWTTKRHRAWPSDFKLSVRTFLMCARARGQQVQLLPSELITEIVRHAAG